VGRQVIGQHEEKPKNFDLDDMPIPAGLSHMFNKAGQDRIVFLSGDINEHSVWHVIGQLISLANYDSTAPIQLVISTYGGSVHEMFAIYDILKFLPCPIVTTAIGKCMSAGILLLASGTKGKRMVGANARIMLHPIRSMTGGNILEMSNDINEHDKLQQKMVELLSKETGMTKDKIMKIMKSGHDSYYSAEEAIKMGIADRIIGA
jgi:ATP-dependent Clp protease, protease subunit